MNNSISCDVPIPEKFPIGDFAVILCKRCKKRYQLSLMITHGQAVEYHTCPRCQSFITVLSSNDVGLDTRGQGNIIGTFTVCANSNNPILQPSI